VLKIWIHNLVLSALRELLPESWGTAAIGALALTPVLAQFAAAAIRGAVAAPRAGGLPLGLALVLSPPTRVATLVILALLEAMARMGGVDLRRIGKQRRDRAEHGQDGQPAHEASSGLALPYVSGQGIKLGLVHLLVSLHDGRARPLPATVIALVTILEAQARSAMRKTYRFWAMSGGYPCPQCPLWCRTQGGDGQLSAKRTVSQVQPMQPTG
jgi:hypothetical protein